MGAKTTLPLLFLVSDYLSADTGQAGGYDDSMRVYLPDLDFGSPDQVKILDYVELTYESLREVPISVKVFPRFPITDTEDSSETVSLVTAAAAATEPGVWWGDDTVIWDTAVYATLRMFSQRASFIRMSAKSFGVGLAVDADLTPFRLLKITFGYDFEGGTQQGTAVV